MAPEDVKIIRKPPRPIGDTSARMIREGMYANACCPIARGRTRACSGGDRLVLRRREAGDGYRGCRNPLDTDRALVGDNRRADTAVVAGTRDLSPDALRPRWRPVHL